MPTVDWSSLPGWIALAVVIISIITGLLKQPHENKSLDGNAANQYAQAAAAVAAENIKMTTKISGLEKRIDALESDNMTLKDTIEAERIRSRKFEDWAKRLSYQIRSLGSVPVPFENDEAAAETAKNDNKPKMAGGAMR
jgi:hypothetical protein